MAGKITIKEIDQKKYKVELMGGEYKVFKFSPWHNAYIYFGSYKTRADIVKDLGGSYEKR
jgi:hypothetical protein